MDAGGHLSDCVSLRAVASGYGASLCLLLQFALKFASRWYWVTVPMCLSWVIETTNRGNASSTVIQTAPKRKLNDPIFLTSGKAHRWMRTLKNILHCV